MANKRIVTYGPSNDERVILESLSDEIRFAQCMKLYKAFDTIEELEKALKKKTLKEINKFH